MSYIVLARKWRPQVFEEVVGEDHITTTLKNAISGQRVAHAYMFTGPRGIGKTSVARIFAKALNCEKGPAPIPCNKCISCKGISSGASMDVIEIDGASNNSVDQIRELRENIKFAPSYGRYKIYIIDEVHMLSIGAFNALLKTLEEPPAHAKFIFATTNPEKVPPTILSRCQRFDFVRIPFKLIVEKLKKIISTEKLNVSEEALFTIARASDGSLRDAESILDQLASFSSEKISGEDVIDLLGMIEEDKLAEVVDGLCRKDTAALLKIIDEMISKGKDLSQFIIGLMSYIRNMMVISVSSDLKVLIDFPENYINVLKEQVKKFKIEELLYIFYTLSATLNAVKKSEVARFILEAALIKLSMRGELISLADIVDKVSALESNIGPVKPLSGSSTREREAVKEAIRPVLEEIPVSGVEKEATGSQAEKPVSVNVESTAVEPLTIEKVKHAWPAILQEIKSKKISIASYLLEGDITAIEGSSVVLGFIKKFNFHKEVLEHTGNKKFVESVISAILGINVQIKLVTVEQKEAAQNEGEPYQGGPDGGGRETVKEMEEDSTDNPLIQSALDMFNGKIIRVRENNARNEQA
ncbi:MAG: DNA polymerase III subunit gamma/tau [Candidatus Omnitrophica bacterium]|nr:DNA polymerase III subunit gamma/tau [Candidatus Omnitrophota bacterium]